MSGVNKRTDRPIHWPKRTEEAEIMSGELRHIVQLLSSKVHLGCTDYPLMEQD